MQVHDQQLTPAGPPPAAPPLAAPRRQLPPPSTPPRQPHSPLGWLVVSVAVLSIGVLGLTDLAGAPVPGSAYMALPLAVVGLGLVTGAWYGRARWLIALGAVLAVALGITVGVEKDRRRGPVGHVATDERRATGGHVHDQYGQRRTRPVRGGFHRTQRSG